MQVLPRLTDSQRATLHAKHLAIAAQERAMAAQTALWLAAAEAFRLSPTAQALEKLDAAHEAYREAELRDERVVDEYLSTERTLILIARARWRIRRPLARRGSGRPRTRRARPRARRSRIRALADPEPSPERRRRRVDQPANRARRGRRGVAMPEHRRDPSRPPCARGIDHIHAPRGPQ